MVRESRPTTGVLAARVARLLGTKSFMTENDIDKDPTDVALGKFHLVRLSANVSTEAHRKSSGLVAPIQQVDLPRHGGPRGRAIWNTRCLEFVILLRG